MAYPYDVFGVGNLLMNNHTPAINVTNGTGTGATIGATATTARAVPSSSSSIPTSSRDILLTSFTHLSQQLQWLIRYYDTRDHHRTRNASRSKKLLPIATCISRTINHGHHDHDNSMRMRMPDGVIRLIMDYYGPLVTSRYRTIVVAFPHQHMHGGWSPDAASAWTFINNRYILMRQTGVAMWRMAQWRLWVTDAALGPQYLPSSTFATSVSSSSPNHDDDDGDDNDDDINRAIIDAPKIMTVASNSNTTTTATPSSTATVAAPMPMDDDKTPSIEICLHRNWNAPIVRHPTCDDVWSERGWHGQQLVANMIMKGESAVIVSAPTTTVHDGRQQIYGIHDHTSDGGDRGLLHRFIHAIVNQCHQYNSNIDDEGSEYVVTMSVMEMMNGSNDIYDGIVPLYDRNNDGPDIAMDRKTNVASILDRVTQVRLNDTDASSDDTKRAGIDNGNGTYGVSVSSMITSILRRHKRPGTLVPIRASHYVWTFTCYQRVRSLVDDETTESMSSSSSSTPTPAAVLPIRYDPTGARVVSRLVLVDLLACETARMSATSKEITGMNKFHTTLVNAIAQMRLMEHQRASSSLARLAQLMKPSSPSPSTSASSLSSSPIRGVQRVMASPAASSASASASARGKVKSAAKSKNMATNSSSSSNSSRGVKKKSTATRSASSSATGNGSYGRNGSTPIDALFRGSTILQCLKPLLIAPTTPVIMALFIDCGESDVTTTCHALRQPLTTI